MANFPNMNEQFGAPENLSGMGSPAITGGDDPETVALKKKRQQKIIGIVVGIIVIVVSLIGIAMMALNKMGNKEEEVKAPTKAASSITAQDELRRQLPDFTPPKPAPNPALAAKPETAPVVMPKPVPMPEEKVLITPAMQKPFKTEPTLLEKKLAAPMMGGDRKLAGADRKTGPAKPARIEVEGEEAGPLGEMMKPMKLSEGSAQRAKNRHLTLAQGTFINCIMETAVDTTVPGMVACRIPENVFSMDGKTLLIERGARVFGEYRGAVQKGLERIFMLWTRIETPHGVIINIDSPATDGIGRAGATGEVNHHWWRRFGNALLFSILDDAFQFAMDKARENGDGVNYYSSSQSGMESLIQDLIREATDIPPTMRMNQGTRIGIFVARAIDMSNVYQLEAR